MVKERGEELSEEEKRALRGSKFAPLPSLPPRWLILGGPLTTNKAAALAKFLERKLQDPSGLDNINPHLVERAVQTPNAPFSPDSLQREENVENSKPKKLKKKIKKKRETKDNGGLWLCCGKKAQEEEVRIVIT
ncbi:unnamed protein product [Prunus armeniaca]|uniref:Uncharacterized protein n=1 Tax=Prunus armeniaca TaxID=36596 RepID=A0A6J5W0K9_PRUAR|nr:unnamed protein product [Prunus armeniaca]